MNWAGAFLKFEMNYTVEGNVNPSPILISETFNATSIPWDWENIGTAWTFPGGKATNAATGALNGIMHRLNVGNLSNWTWTTNSNLIPPALDSLP